MAAATAVAGTCRCGHGLPDHQTPGLAPQCTALSCSCLRYRPPVDMVPAHRAPSATTPLARRERCACGHGHKPHEIAGFAPACAVDDCTCTAFHVNNEPAAAAATPEPAAAPDELVSPADAPTPTAYAEPADEAFTVEQLLERGRASDLAAIVKLADKIAELVEDLRERLADEAAAAGVKRLVTDLEKQLSDAREKLRDVGRGRRRTPPRHRRRNQCRRHTHPAPMPGLRPDVRRTARTRRAPRPGARLPEGRVSR